MYKLPFVYRDNNNVVRTQEFFVRPKIKYININNYKTNYKYIQ